LIILTSRLFKASVALIVVGVVLLVILQESYMPKAEAFKNDLLNSTENRLNNTHTELPVPEDYGLDYNTLLLIVTLGNIAYVLLLIGAAFFVIILIAHLVKRTRGYDAAKPIDETPKTS
jgi:hypothetical protein